MADALTQDHTFAVHLLMEDLESEVNVMYKIGQNLHNTLIDMIEFSKINVKKHTVGNLMTCQVLINALMEITK